MNVGMLYEKRTWIGFGVAVGVMVLSLLLGALVIVRGVLPMEVVSPWLWVSYALAALFGGRVAAAGQGRQLCAFVPGVLLYALAWLLALCSECSIDFAANGAGTTIAAVAGMIVAFLSCGKKKKHSRGGKGRRPQARPKRR